MRISTLTIQTTLRQQMSSLQADSAAKSEELSSGSKASSYKAIAGSAREVSQLTADLVVSAQYSQAGESTLSRVDAMYDAVGQMVTLASDLRSSLSSVLGQDGIAASGIDDEARTALDSAAQLLNSQFEGRYLFGGSVTDRAPVDLDGYAAQSAPSGTDLSYYGGDSTRASYQASDSLSVEYGATGDEAGFEQLIRACSLVANASLDPVDDTALGEAYDLLGEAIDGLSTIQSGLSSSSDAIDRAIDLEMDRQLNLEGRLSDLTDADTAAVYTQLQTLSSQLDATYSATKTLLSLNLFDSLK
ncbi:flagellar hook-associated protein 3 FlgL [Tistlia consotensis]|uniref:Flagellar hook-associated protein 3 FlgL n=1 Tax=Tistlia consotensis USBA 355 TaxID=560819 RepID=A0A1Y6BCN1_9PROT|nr:flagellar biosynthesis protein FlgL [Tistlia consotensis]SME96930.1 flagellar hook-associated protein 3 FlgL [Tistlia consotensis USBA 355]SNR56328.1 flagellar hook-associated protein 3 FlgL [Tistlia consotensis]